jgi:hypothetical protein
MLRRPSNDVPDFLSALEFLPVLDPQEVQNSLDHRVVQLDRELGGMRAALASIGDRLPRVFTIENEYGIAMKQAERDWSAAIAEELRAGGLTWSYDELIEWAKTSPFSLVTRSHD